MNSLDIDGYQLKFLSEGTGPDVLIVGSCLYSSRTFSRNLRTQVRLHFIDYRGFAEGPPTELTLDQLLEDIEKCRQKLDLKKCVIVGHSAHGLLALEYAKKYPQYVSHVVMIGCPPNMDAYHVTMTQNQWNESVCPERKAAFARNLERLPDEMLNQLPRNEWFRQMNFRNVPKSWYDYDFDSKPLWEGIHPNTHILDQMYLRFAREIDIAQGLENFDRPVLVAYGRFEYLVAPVQSWDPLRTKFKNLTIRIFEKSAHVPQYEEPTLFDQEFLTWLGSTLSS